MSSVYGSADSAEHRSELSVYPGTTQPSARTLAGFRRASRPRCLDVGSKRCGSTKT